MKLYYFETSAVNFLAKTLSIGDAIATRPYQELRGRRWVISPVVIAEILLTSTDVARENLIYFCQHLFSRELLPSPEEFLVRYVEAGCPEIQQPHSLVSESDVAATWRDLYDYPDKTFIYDAAAFRKRAKLFSSSLVRDLHRATRNRKLTLSHYGRDISLDLTLEQAISLMPSVRNGRWLSDEERTLWRIGVFYALVLLCAELGPDPAPLATFWRRIGVRDTGERLLYLLTQREAVIYRGPIANMAYMTRLQCNQKYSRGIYWDSLHAMYLTYVTRFMAEDEHFKVLQEAIDWHVNSTRIRRPSEMQWTYAPRTNPDGRSFIET